MKTVGIQTLGCKVNLYESEYITNILKDAGYIIKDFKEVCDIYIINTCAVTNTSDIKSKKTIKNAIRRNKDAIIIVMGCFIETNKDYHEDGVDIYLGNKDKSKIVDLINEYLENKNTIKRYYEEHNEFEDMYINDFPGRTRAFVKIEDGCENFCSFCIIPYARGKIRSKDFNKVIEEVKSLVDNNYKGVVLTGINTGKYGIDIDKSLSLLLNELIKINNLERIRISSIEVTEIDDNLLKIIEDNDIIVDHLHIPLQAGSDKILKLMNRKYDLKYFEEKLNKIRSIRPDISITTDIIVGFPNEIDDDFKDTISTSKKFKFSKIHVFPYSRRTGTVADKMDNQVDSDVKKIRARKLLEVSKELEIDYFNKFIGKELDVLIETNKDGYSYGHTGNYLNTKIKGNLEHNKNYNIKLLKIEYPYILGEVCERNKY